MKCLKRCTLLALLSLLITSCDGPLGFAIHNAKVDDHTYRIDYGADTVMDFVLKNNQMLLLGSINGDSDTLLYDSGSSYYLVRFFNERNKPDGVRFYHIPVTGADKQADMKATTDSCRIELPIRKVKAMQMLLLMEEKHACEKELRVNRYPILGFPAMDGVMLNFSENKIHEQVHLKNLDTVTEFHSVKCRRDWRGVLFIYPVIDGVEWECVFDTGNSSGILLKDENRVDHPNETDMLYEGSYGLALGGKTSHQHYVVAQNVGIDLGGWRDTCQVMYVKELEFNNVGMQYISKFDWVIFGYMDKVYARPRTMDTLEQVKRRNPRYGITTMDGDIRILTRLLDGHEAFRVDDRIKSVNGEEITPENICDYYKLLSESDDWTEFDIEVGFIGGRK